MTTHCIPCNTVTIIYHVGGDAALNSRYPHILGWHHFINSYHPAVYIVGTLESALSHILRKCCSVYYRTVFRNDHGTNIGLVYVAMMSALCKTIIAGDDHDIWVRYGPYFVNANGDADHGHVHETGAAQTLLQPYSTPMLSAEREYSGL